MNKAVFLDRDGTIIVDRHYLCDPKDVVLLPDAARALGMLRQAGFRLFLFSNQSGVGRGFFPLEAVHRCNARMIELLNLGADLFTDICIAPEAPEDKAVYRKPNPRFILESLEKHRLDRTHCWMVGDNQSDAKAGLNAGINAALIGGGTHAVEKNVLRSESLYSFANTVCL
ncbi:MAG: HAD-IIIA family hydrolase [Opitutus sp.]